MSSRNIARKKLERVRPHKRDVPIGFLIPAVAVFGVIVIAPSIGGIYLSFTNFDGVGTPQWSGLQNYLAVFADPQARSALVNTFALAFAIVIGQNLLGFALALALEKPFAGRNILRVLFLLPAVLSPVIIGFLWQYIYSPTGALNSVLTNLGVGSAKDFAWLGDPHTALAAVAATTIWQLAGYAMVIYVAGLHGIPAEIVDAASTDGANAWQRLIHIRIPLLAPAITINLALSLITGLRIFDQVIAMTGGGPGYATETISTLVYKQGFVFNHVGYSLALAIILAIFIAALTAVQVRATTRADSK